MGQIWFGEDYSRREVVEVRLDEAETKSGTATGNKQATISPADRVDSSAIFFIRRCVEMTQKKKSDTELQEARLARFEAEQKISKIADLSNKEICALEADLQRQLAQIKKAKARKERAAEDRKKILVGAWCLKRASENPEYNTKLLKALDSYLTRDDDRALFGLASKDAATEKPTEGVSSSPEDQLAAAQKMTPNAADHGDPSKVVGRNAAEGPKNGPEGHKQEQGGLWDKAKGMLSK